MTLTVGLIQLNSGDDPAKNLGQTLALVNQAADRGAQFVLTPEVTNIVSDSRKHQADVLQTEPGDRSLAALQQLASKRGIWLLIGSLALKTDDPDGRFANRSFLISPSGDIRARYDKMHMFDVAVSDTETYTESAGYRPGNRAVLAQTDFGTLGLSICYDLRFPLLYRYLAQAGAKIITVPSAFSPVTGAAHWETLLRARAIETASFVLAPAQTGRHGANRQTYGHSMVVDPWGQVLLDAGTQTGAFIVNLDLNAVEQIRKRIPSLTHDRPYQGPENAQ
jgi:predicted amidohydrolase